MDASRVRLASVTDWLVAVVFLVATVGVCLLIVHEMTAISTPPSVAPAAVSPAATPSALPASSVAVRLLRLPGGRELRFGDSLDTVSSLLGREAETGVQSTENTRIGTRLIRGYEYAHIRFTLVFEPFEKGGELRVAGIYLQ